MDHISPRRLFYLSQLDATGIAAQGSEPEKQHLRECDECQQIIAVLARQFDEHNPPHDQQSGG